MIEQNLFLLLFCLKFFSIVTYMVSSSIRLKSIKLPGYRSLISEPIIGGRSLSSKIAKKKGVNFDLIFRMMATSVSEWKFIIASAFKFKLLCQPEAAGCSPDHNGHEPSGQKLAAPGGYFYSGCSPDHKHLQLPKCRLM